MAMISLELGEDLLLKVVDVTDSLPALHPEETQLCLAIRNVKKRATFQLGRGAAQLALNELGVSSPVLRQISGAPLWPSGFRGSISHTGSVAVALVGRAQDYSFIGVDVELFARAIGRDISKRICVPSELAQLSTMPRERQRETLGLFSAKEATYKAFSEPLGSYFGFRDVELTALNPATEYEGRFLISLPLGRIPSKFRVQQRIEGEFLLSFVAM